MKYTTLSRQTVAFLSSTDFNFNAWEGFTNDIKQDLAENKSKVVCTYRNINTVMWRCVHKITRFTLEQISRKLNTADQNTPCSTLQISKLYNRLGFQRAFENISWLLYRLIWHVHHNMIATFLQSDDHKHNIFYKILVLWWKTAGKCAKSSGWSRWLALNLIPEKGNPIVMKAIKINETGGLSRLKYEDVPIPEPQHSEVRTRSNHPFDLRTYALIGYDF